MLSNPTDHAGLTLDGTGSQPAGSVKSDEPVFFMIGRLRRPHGLRGELIFEVFSTHSQIIRPGTLLYVGEEHIEMEVSHIRRHNKFFIISLKGITNRDQVEGIRNKSLYMKMDSLPELAEGEYYYDQLIGMSVLGETGMVLGEISEIIKTGANDVYVVKPEKGAEILLPAIKDVILNVDISNQQMIVRPPEWEK